MSSEGMSPYQAEADPATPPELPTNVSKVPMFLGVFHLSIGGLFLVSGLLGLLSSESQVERLEANFSSLEAGGLTLSQEALDALDLLQGPSAVVNGFDLVASLLMAIAGWGLLKYRSWGRTVSNVYAVFSLSVKAGNFYVMSVLAPPFYEALIASVPALGEVGASGIENIVLTSVLVTALYPIATLFIVNQRLVKRGLS